MSEQIRREFTLAFSLDKVKTAINDACRTSPGGRQLKDYNAAFNTYSITLVRNLYVLPTTITLKALSENETQFELSAIPGPHLARMASFTSSMIEDFLKQIGDFASGKLVIKTTVPQSVIPPSAGRTAIGWVILIGGLAFLVAVLWYISKH
jgi:hypothetical protein